MQALALARPLLLLALLWPKGGSIPADGGAGIGLALAYAGVMLGVVTLWARHWRVRPLAPGAAERDVSWMRGPYRFVRHPMPLATLAVALGWCLLYRSAANAVLLAAFALATALAMRARDARLAAAGPRCAAWVDALPALLPGRRRVARGRD